ncbi:MAG: hypothetical protein P8020_06475 [Acidobacteriota bacterium]|jgi:hypothetical protein
MSVIGNAGRSVARGLAIDQAQRLGSRIEKSTGNLKSETGRRIESLAAQIRSLGKDLESPFEAGRLARELQRTADYVRYRRSSDIAADTWRFVKTNRSVWVAGGIAAGLLGYLLTRKHR